MPKLPKVPLQVPSVLSGFIDFLKKQNVVGLAVGLVLGSAAKGVVDSLVADIFNPLLGFLMGGGTDLSDKLICLHAVAGVCKTKLAWGHFLTVLIQFVLVAAVVYFVINRTIELFSDSKEKKKTEKT